MSQINILKCIKFEYDLSMASKLRLCSRGKLNINNKTSKEKKKLIL